jgi:hypothetical protein
MKTYLMLISFLIAITGCEYEEKPPKNSDVIKDITFGSPYLEADGVSRTKVMVDLPIDADAGKRTVEISTTAGTFAETDKKNVVSVVAEQLETTNPYRLVAQATLVSAPTDGTLTVTARTAGYSQSKPYSFSIAQPESMTITADRLTLKQGYDNEVKFTVTLFRNSGIPSLNRMVSLVVEDPNNNNKSVGRFREQLVRSDAAGKCYFTYTLGDDAVLGKLNVKATTDPKLVATETINAIKP